MGVGMSTELSAQDLEFQDIINRISAREENNIIYNNNKIRSYLFDSSNAKELSIYLKSINMAIKKCRLELLLNILKGFSDIYKFAAVDIKYFDEYNITLKTDILRTFALKGDIRLVAKNLNGMLNIFESIETLSATNAAIAINSAITLGEVKKAETILLDKNLEHAFIEQIKKRYYDNFSKKLSDDIKKIPLYECRKRAILERLEGF